MNPALKWAARTFVGHPGWLRFRSDFEDSLDSECLAASQFSHVEAKREGIP